MTRKDSIWQSAAVARDFLEGMRGGIPQAAEQLDVMLRLIQTSRPQLHNFLDIGCGDGILGQAVLNQFPQAQGILLDFSEPMIEAARKKFEGKPVTFVIEDYGAPEWIQSVQDYAPYDAIVSGYSIHHQPDKRKRQLYGEIYHLLKPGGIFINIEHVAPASAWLEDHFSEIFIDSMTIAYQQQGIKKSRQEVATEYHERPHRDANILAPLDLQCDWLRQIGYQHVDCYLKIFELAVFGGIRPDE